MPEYSMEGQQEGYIYSLCHLRSLYLLPSKHDLCTPVAVTYLICGIEFDYFKGSFYSTRSRYDFMIHLVFMLCYRMILGLEPAGEEPTRAMSLSLEFFRLLRILEGDLYRMEKMLWISDSPGQIRS